MIFLEHGSQEYRLETARSVDYQITVDGKPVGYVKPAKGFFSRKIHFLVPTSLPLTKTTSDDLDASTQSILSLRGL